MLKEKRHGKQHLKVTVPSNINEYLDGHIATLRPEGSFDGTKILLEKRKLMRPKFSIVAALLDLLIPYALAILGMNMLFEHLSNSAIWVVSLVYFILRLKRIFMWAVLLYQRFASENVRNSCSLTPSCSEYMFMSINKYGVLPGIVKGIDRLLRCREVSNEDDYP